MQRLIMSILPELFACQRGLARWSSSFLWRQVPDDVLHPGDGRQRCCTVAFCAQPLGNSRVDEVSKIFREPRLLRSILIDYPDLLGHLNEFIQIPPIQI